LGLTVPSVGKDLAAIKIGNWDVQTVKLWTCYIFFVQGALLNTDDVKKAFAAICPVLYGITTILFITPLMSIPISCLTFLQHELRTGLIIFVNMAGTMSAGVQMATAAGGHFAFALLLSVATNILSLFTVPFYLSMLMSRSGGVQIDPFPMLCDLLSTIFLPLCLGKAVNMGSSVFCGLLASWKTPIFFSVNTAQAVIQLIKMSQSADAICRLDFGSVLAVVLVTVGVHIVFLIWNVFLTGLLGFRLDLRKSLIIMCSQKNSVLAMAVLSFLPASIGDQGTMAISCILGTFSQLIIDAYLVGPLACWTAEAPSDSSSSIHSLWDSWVPGLFRNRLTGKSVDNAAAHVMPCFHELLIQQEPDLSELMGRLQDTEMELANLNLSSFFQLILDAYILGPWMAFQTRQAPRSSSCGSFEKPKAPSRSASWASFQSTQAPSRSSSCATFQSLQAFSRNSSFGNLGSFPDDGYDMPCGHEWVIENDLDYQKLLGRLQETEAEVAQLKDEVARCNDRPVNGWFVVMTLANKGAGLIEWISLKCVSLKDEVARVVGIVQSRFAAHADGLFRMVTARYDEVVGSSDNRLKPVVDTSSLDLDFIQSQGRLPIASWTLGQSVDFDNEIAALSVREKNQGTVNKVALEIC
jgi:sodium/bile acid cotransporter 7